MERRLGLCRGCEAWQGNGRRVGVGQVSVAVDDTSGSYAGNQGLLDDVEKQLYQRIVDFRSATSCLAGAASGSSLGDLQAAKRVGRYLWKVPVAWQGNACCSPGRGMLWCYLDGVWTLACSLV